MFNLNSLLQNINEQDIIAAKENSQKMVFSGIGLKGPHPLRMIAYEGNHNKQIQQQNP